MNHDTATPIQILLVEDNPGDARLVAETLADADRDQFVLTRAERLSEGLALLRERAFDAVLLDLSLPDSNGIATLERVLEQNPNLPVVVLTMNNDEHLGVQAVHAGAQDYLQKGRNDHELLARSVRYAIERQHLLTELNHVRQQEQLARSASEIAAVEQLSHDVRTTITAQMYSSMPLRDARPDLFHEMVDRYALVLDQSLERRAYKVDPDISDPLRELANQLGFLHAGPRDVVDVHTHALRQQVRNAAMPRMQAYVEEGRLLVLELMGYLASYYRNHAFGSER